MGRKREITRKQHVVNQAIKWGLIIFLAWFFGKYILWNTLDYLVPYRATAYHAKLALYGTILFAALSILLSTIRDGQNIIRLRIPTDNINVDAEGKYLELLVFSSRIILAGCTSLYWFKQGEYLQNQKYITVGSNLFIILLLLGMGTAVITLFSSYMIILEPWRIFLRKINISKPVILLFASRCLFFLVVNLLFLFYFVPGLTTKLPSVLIGIVSLVVIIRSQIIYYKRNKTNL